jgi:hypothetical protein
MYETLPLYFLWLWGSRETDKYYVVKKWPARGDFVPGKHDVKNASLVNPVKLLLFSLHIKLGLMKNFVKDLGKVMRVSCIFTVIF